MDYREEPFVNFPQLNPLLYRFFRKIVMNAPFVVILLVIPIISRAQVRVGAEVLFQKQFALVEGKRVGLVTNHSALLSNGQHLADALFLEKRTHLAVLFGPEHGIRGDTPDGAAVHNSTDSQTGLPVYSLFGGVNKPTDAMLADVDVLVFDIQDIGARFYTYESTLSLAMEAAAEHHIPFIVLDRPNPIRGSWVEGFVLTDSLKSFVGMHPIPVAHGMTIGELARLYNEEGWLKNGVKANLTVVKMEGWKRDAWFDETGLRWVRPSPNMSTLKTATVYPGTCFIEGTNLSEGRGTEKPFEWIGAPFVDGGQWAATLNSYHLAGVIFEPVEFTPREIASVASNPKYKGVRCGGIFVNVTDRTSYQPVATAVYILSSAKALFGSKFEWKQRGIDRLAGTTTLRTAIDAGESPERIDQTWKKDVERFQTVRKKYLLY